MITLVAAGSDAHYGDAAELFRLYAGIPGIEVCLDSLDREVSDLPGEYSPPRGTILLAYDGDRAVGVVGLVPLDSPGECEMRRLYVLEEARRTGAGRRLAEALLESAARMGYRTMRLATLPERMPAALALYRSLGFTETGPYGDSPAPGALHMERSLP